MEKIIKKSYQNLMKNFGNILLLFIIQVAIVLVVDRIFSIGNIENTFAIILSYLISGLITAVVGDYIKLETYLAYKEERKVRPFGIFKLFSEYDADLLKVSVIKTIKIYLWSLLFVIPGIYKMLEYNRVLVSKVDNYELETVYCFEKSKQEMYGRKAEFLGYNILILLPMIVIFIISTVAVSGYMLRLSTAKIDPSVIIVSSMSGLLFLFFLLFILTFITGLISISLHATFNSELTKHLDPNKIDNELISIEYEEIFEEKDDKM